MNIATSAGQFKSKVLRKVTSKTMSIGKKRKQIARQATKMRWAGSHIDQSYT